MTSSVWAKLTAVFAEIPSPLFDKIGVGAAIALTLSGIILNAYLPQLQTTLEEDAKDSKITNDEARRKIRFYGRCASLMTLVGVLVLVFVLIDFVR